MREAEVAVLRRGVFSLLVAVMLISASSWILSVSVGLDGILIPARRKHKDSIIKQVFCVITDAKLVLDSCLRNTYF